MAEPIETSAIILASYDLGESDKIVTFFTPTNGKERAIAKGAKKSQKRFLNKLEPFTYLTLQLVSHRHGGISRIESAEVAHSFDTLRFNPQQFLFATLACELIDKWTKEGDPCPKIFHLFLWLLNKLNELQDNRIKLKGHPIIPARNAMIFFQIKLLQLVGYALDWNRCMVCNAHLAGGRSIHIYERGVVCESCQTGSPADICEACHGAIKAIHFLQGSDFGDIHKLVLSDDMWTEIWDILERLHKRYISRLSTSRIHTYDVLRKYNMSDRQAFSTGAICANKAA